jgi:hypothetical protein
MLALAVAIGGGALAVQWYFQRYGAVVYTQHGLDLEVNLQSCRLDLTATGTYHSDWWQLSDCIPEVIDLDLR